MPQQVEIKISEFSTTPGGRYRKDYKKSGEEFFEDRLKQCLEDPQAVVTLDLDRVIALPSSFLDEIFTRAVERFGAAVRDRIRFKAVDKPTRIADAQHYLDRAVKQYGKT